ncbi:hypothetical protein Ancab_035932 [Ancistrocladus abbreviatus]
MTRRFLISFIFLGLTGTETVNLFRIEDQMQVAGLEAHVLWVNHCHEMQISTHFCLGSSSEEVSSQHINHSFFILFWCSSNASGGIVCCGQLSGLDFDAI